MKYKLIQLIENAEKPDVQVGTKEIVQFDFEWAEAHSVPAVALEIDASGEIVGFAVTSACASLFEALRLHMLDM